MADIKTSLLPSATALTGTEKVVVVQDGETKIATADQVHSFSGPVLWSWNGTDVSQFGAQVNIGAVTGTVVPSVLAVGSTRVNPHLVLTCTSLEIGNTRAAIIPITDIVLPRRYVVEFRIVLTALGSTARQFGFVYYMTPSAQYGILMMRRHLVTNRDGARLEAGAIASQTTMLTTAQMTQGALYREVFEAQLSTPGTSGPGAYRVQTTHEPPEATSIIRTCTDVNTTLSGGAFGDWTGQTPTSIGLVISAGTDASAWSGSIELDHLRILKHPMDA